MRRLLLLLLGGLVLAVLPASPAFAHAALLESLPGDGVVLQQAPGEVVLRFNQPVGTSLGAVRVVGPDGDRVDDGAPERRDGGKEVAVGLTGASARGTYVLLWRVMSEDSHAVTGASVFSVGEPSEPATAAEADDAAVGLPLRTARLVSFVGVLLLVGSVVVPLVAWPAGLALRGVRALMVVGGGLVATGTAGGLLAQGPNAAGLPLRSGVSLLPEVLGTRFGVAHAARLALLGLLAVTLVAVVRRWVTGRVALVAVGVTGLPMLATWSVAGHASAGSLAAVAVPVDALHLLAVGVWAGGLVVLVAALLRQRDPEVLTEALQRWSRLAVVAVVAMVVTGTFAAWREVRGLDALGGTAYGRILLLKVCLVLVMLYAGNRGREVVRRTAARRGGLAVVHASVATDERPPPATDRVRELRRSTWVEVVVATLVVLVTTVLVDTPPAASDYARPLSSVQQVEDDLRVQLDLDSARVGANTLHVYLTGPGGRAVDVPEVTGRVVREDGESLPLRIGRISLGHYEATNSLVVPYRGDWELEVRIRTSDIDSSTVRETVTFR